MGFFNESYTPHGQGFDHSFGFLCACHDVNHWNEGGHFTTTHACTVAHTESRILIGLQVSVRH